MEEMVEPAPEEEEIPAPEEEVAVPPVEEPAPTLEEEAPPVEEMVEPAPEEEIPAPEEEAVVAPEGVAPAEAMEALRTEDLDAFIAAQRAYTDEHPEDHEAQLELGRTLWQAGTREDAVEAYERLIVEQALLGDVIADLENYAEQWPDASVMQALGDAYMKHDQLQEALDTYRRALASL